MHLQLWPRGPGPHCFIPSQAVENLPSARHARILCRAGFCVTVWCLSVCPSMSHATACCCGPDWLECGQCRVVSVRTKLNTDLFHQSYTEHSGRTSVSGRRTFLVLRSTCSWWVTTNVAKPSATGQPTQPFILSGSIKWVVSWNQMCAAVYRKRHLVRVTKVNAGLAETNGRLLMGIWRDSLHVTCGLTACTPGSAPGPTLGYEYGKTLPFLLKAWLGRISQVLCKLSVLEDVVIITAFHCWRWPVACTISCGLWNVCTNWNLFLICQLDLYGLAFVVIPEKYSAIAAFGAACRKDLFDLEKVIYSKL